MKLAMIAVAGLAGVASAQSADVFAGPSTGARADAYRVYNGGSLGGLDATLWDNGGLQTSPGFSELQGTDNILGYGAQLAGGGTTNNKVGDDFVVSGGGWNVTQLCFFGYQTGASATAASTFTNVNWEIFSGPVGDTTNSVASGSGLDASNFSGLHRVSAGSTLTNRQIFVNEVNVSVNLPDGNYWVAWQFEGSLASGPWAPPVTPRGAGSNGVQSINGGAYAPVTQANLEPDDFPFMIKGNVVPAPASLALVGLGGLIAGRRRR
ncbi:MAG: PEP-CTERM sorting domain-containing protein [Phycisphaerales bacterium]|nr:PEP-CTERM sorting domain-containing protein [Phycisphaerales bacterium]